MTTVWALVVALLAPLPGEIVPVPGPGDPRIQSVAYDPADVVRLDLAVGFQTALEFAPGERIETVAVGNSAVWQATLNRRGDRLFIKPVTLGPPSNMTVVTDTRVYIFALEARALPEINTAYLVRFTYGASRYVSSASGTAPGHRYRLSGDRALQPVVLNDDGERTTMAWPADSLLPAVYAIDATGRERLVDVNVRNGVYVLDEVAQTLVFRRGDRAAEARRLSSPVAP